MARLTLFDLYETLVYPRFEEIVHWRQMGHREGDIAVMCGVSASSFKKMKKEYPELAELMLHSKARLIMSIEKTLFQKALDGDKTCIIFALKNLAPDRWKDVHQVENTSDIRIVDDLAMPLLEEKTGMVKSVKRGRPRKVRYDLDNADINYLPKFEEDD